MKAIFTLAIFILVASLNVIGSPVDSMPAIKIPSSPSYKPAKPVTNSGVSIMFLCGVRKPATDEEPLLVVDGIPKRSEYLKELNPDDIESINILKDAASAVIYNCRASRGVILVTTKPVIKRKLIVRDILTGERIRFATVCFTSVADTLKIVADESGMVITDRLKAGNQYMVTVSSAGYKTYSTALKGKEQEVLLEKDVKLCGEVVVVAYTIICRRSLLLCGTSMTKVGMQPADEKDSALFVSPAHRTIVSLYPNPVQRNNSFNIELRSELEDVIQLAVYDMNGKLVFIQSKKLFAGLNRIAVNADGRWAGGVYNVLVKNQRGVAIKAEKLVIQ